jgi:DNA repair exonuclease SbcCD ATPase subunit
MEGLRNELASAREEVVSLERAKRAAQERQAELEELVEEMTRHAGQIQVATSHDGGKEAETKMLRDMLRERDAEIATLRRQTGEASRHDSDVEAVWMLLGGKNRASMSLLEGVGAVVKDRERLRVEVARNSDQLADAADSINKVGLSASPCHVCLWSRVNQEPLLLSRSNQEPLSIERSLLFSIERSLLFSSLTRAPAG